MGMVIGPHIYSAGPISDGLPLIGKAGIWNCPTLVIASSRSTTRAVPEGAKRRTSSNCRALRKGIPSLARG